MTRHYSPNFTTRPHNINISGQSSISLSRKILPFGGNRGVSSPKIVNHDRARRVKPPQKIPLIRFHQGLIEPLISRDDRVQRKLLGPRLITAAQFLGQRRIFEDGDKPRSELVPLT